MFKIYFIDLCLSLESVLAVRKETMLFSIPNYYALKVVI